MARRQFTKEFKVVAIKECSKACRLRMWRLRSRSALLVKPEKGIKQVSPYIFYAQKANVGIIPPFDGLLPDFAHLSVKGFRDTDGDRRRVTAETAACPVGSVATFKLRIGSGALGCLPGP